MEHQLNLFGGEVVETDKKYTKKITIPIYEPKPNRGGVRELYDTRKLWYLTQAIKKSNISDEEKEFLIEAAHRHVRFNYAKIADYYASASAEMQDLMERSALVIVDFDKAIENGFVRLSDNISNLYMEECNEG